MVDVVNVQNNEQNYVFLVKIVNIMKRFTNKEQTHHLIELGFPRPCSISDFEEIVDYPGTTVIFDYDYSIGELIEFLGMHLTGIHPTTVCDLPIIYVVQYKRKLKSAGYTQIQGELIDKLYDACVELKNEGVI